MLIYLREKGISIELVLVNLRKGDQREPVHLSRNPTGALPVLELDSGEFITESLPIIEYLEELYPEPMMIGPDALSRAKIRAYERQVEVGILNPIARFVHATNSPLGLPARPEIAAAESKRLPPVLARVDARIGSSPFAAGEAPSIVDCTLFAGLQFGEMFGVGLRDGYANIRRWRDAFKQRPSMQL